MESSIISKDYTDDVKDGNKGHKKRNNFINFCPRNGKRQPASYATPEPLTEDPLVEKEVFEADDAYDDERDRNYGNYIIHDLNDSFEFETDLTDQFGRVVLACRTEN